MVWRFNRLRDMIIKRQKEFGLREKVAKTVLTAANKVSKSSLKNSIKSGSKTVAKSINKSHEANVLKEYANNPKLMARKQAKLARTRKNRLKGYEKRAAELLNAQPNTVKTKEQIDLAAKNIADNHLTPRGVINGITAVPRSIMKGVNKVYAGTGDLLTSAGSAVVKNPGFEIAMRTGDAVNAIGTSMGHPEVLMFPVGGILAGPMVAAQNKVLPRNTRRKMRQLGIKIKKSKLSNWSLQKSVNTAAPYFRTPGLVGM